MRHIPEGVLRRVVDEPLAVPDRAARHLETCRRCRARFDQVREDALAAGLLFSSTAAGDPDAAWHRLRTWAPLRARSSLGRVRRRRWRLIGTSVSTGASVAAAGVLLAGVAAAATLTTVFAPTAVAPLAVSSTDLTELASVLGVGQSSALGVRSTSGHETLPFGTVQWSSGGRVERVASLAAAEAATGLSVTLPQSLPAGVGALADFGVLRQVTATIVFNSSAGPALAGSTLTVTIGPGLDVTYANATALGVGVDPLGIVWMKRPVATSTGATTADIENFLLAQPGIPRDLARELRLLGDLSTTLPIPTPPGANSETTTVDGAPAIVLTDSSKTASGVIWEDHAGIVHAAVGLLDRSDVLNVAQQIG